MGSGSIVTLTHALTQTPDGEGQNNNFRNLKERPSNWVEIAIVPLYC